MPPVTSKNPWAYLNQEKASIGAAIAENRQIYPVNPKHPMAALEIPLPRMIKIDSEDPLTHLQDENAPPRYAKRNEIKHCTTKKQTPIFKLPNSLPPT